MRLPALLTVVLFPLSQACMPQLSDPTQPPLVRPPTPSPCASCPRTLANGNLASGQCEIHRTCVACTPTQASYSLILSCLVATVVCPSSLASPRVRLLKTDGTYTDVVYTAPLSGIACTGGSWGYTTPAGFNVTNIAKAICFGTSPGFQESPIHINTSTAVHTAEYDASQFVVKYGVDIVEEVEIHRNYSGFHVDIKHDAQAFFSASHLDARYRLVQYHAHWNVNGTQRGSEHVIDGKFYTAEFHFVHIREDFHSFQEAVGKDGVAVIGVFAELSEHDNPLLRPLIDSIEKWEEHGDEDAPGHGDIVHQDPAVLIPSDHRYYSYTGSLTTRDMQKCVAWNVLRTPITISQHQLDVLGKLITKNYKEVVAIEKGTTVYTSEASEASNNHVVAHQEKGKQKEEENEEEKEEGEEKEKEKKEKDEKEEEEEVEYYERASQILRTKNATAESEKEEEQELVKGVEKPPNGLDFLNRMVQTYTRGMGDWRSKISKWKLFS